MIRVIWKYAKFPITGAILVLLLSQLDFRSVQVLLLPDNQAMFLLAAGVYLVTNTMLQSLRTFYVMRRFVKSYWRVSAVNLISVFWGTFFPGSSGTDVVRVLYFKKDTGTWEKAFHLTMVERLMGLLVFVVYSVGYSAVNVEVASVLFGAVKLRFEVLAGFLALAVAIACSLLVRKVRIWVVKVFKKATTLLWTLLIHLKGYRLGELMVQFALTLLFQGGRVLGLSVLLACFGHHPTALDLFFVLSVTGVVSLIPLTLGSLGVREGAIVALLFAFGIPVGDGLTCAVSMRLFDFMAAGIGSLVYLGYQIRERHDIRAEAASVKTTTPN